MESSQWIEQNVGRAQRALTSIIAFFMKSDMPVLLKALHEVAASLVPFGVAIRWSGSCM